MNLLENGVSGNFAVPPTREVTEKPTFQDVDIQPRRKGRQRRSPSRMKNPWITKKSTVEKLNTMRNGIANASGPVSNLNRSIPIEAMRNNPDERTLSEKCHAAA